MFAQHLLTAWAGCAASAYFLGGLGRAPQPLSFLLPTTHGGSHAPTHARAIPQATLNCLLGPPGVNRAAHLALTCTLGPAGIALLTINRVSPLPAVMSKGSNTLILYGAVIIVCYMVAPLSAMWLYPLLSSLLAGLCLGCAVTVAVSLLVLPTSAGDAARAKLAAALRGAGHAASRNAARLLRPGGCAACTAPVLVLGHEEVQVRGVDLNMIANFYTDALQLFTKPMTGACPACLGRGGKQEGHPFFAVLQTSRDAIQKLAGGAGGDRPR